MLASFTFLFLPPIALHRDLQVPCLTLLFTIVTFYSFSLLLYTRIFRLATNGRVNLLNITCFFKSTGELHFYIICGFTFR